VRACVLTQRSVFNDELWALWEGGFPHVLDKNTLETKREERFGGKVLSKDMAFTAHAKLVRSKTGQRTLVGLAIDYQQLFMGKAVLTVVEADEGVPVAQARVRAHRLPKDVKGLIVHDFSVTDDWVICVVSPVALSAVKLFLGYAQQDFLGRGKGCTRVFLLPRAGNGASAIKTFALNDASHVYHHIGAFVAPDGRIVLDVLATPQLWPLEPQNLHEDMRNPVNRPKVERWVLGDDSGVVERQRLWGGRTEDAGACELPITFRPHHAALYDEVYFIDQSIEREDGVAVEPQTSIVKLSGLASVHGPFACQTWSAPPRTYVGEPAPVEAMGGNAYVLVPLQDMARSVGGLAVLDAASMRAVAMLWADVWWPTT